MVLEFLSWLPDYEAHTCALLTAALRLIYIGFHPPQSPVLVVFAPLSVCACTHMLTSSCKAPNLFLMFFFPTGYLRPAG